MNNYNVTPFATSLLPSVKTVDLNYAAVGDILNYTIVINNNTSADATSLIVTDLIPQGANFVANSVQIDGITQNGIDPALGINYGTLVNGATTTITMQALVITVPWSGSLINYAQLDYQYVDLTTTPSTVTASVDSNSVTTTINAPLLTLVKSSDTSIITNVGQSINYTLKLTNNGTVTADNIIFMDTLPSSISFVPNSISILGTPVPGTTIEPPTGFNFGDLPVGSYTTLSFKVTVTSIPPSGNIANECGATYNYVINPDTGRSNSSSALSNLLTISSSTLSANLSGITKIVDKAYATIGDILTYTITVPNSGNTTAINVVISDTIPSGLSYISNSLTVNGVASTYLPISIYLGSISSGATATIQFQLLIN